jgi:hypothetical protein
MSIAKPNVNLCSNCYDNAATLFPERTMWVKHKSLFELNTQPTMPVRSIASDSFV